MDIVYIYGLIDPRNELTIENVRYVGKTKNTVNRRISKHVEDSRKKKSPNLKDLWINGLLKEGIRPTYIELKISDDLNWVEDEKYFIKKLRNENNLLNISAGGVIGGNYYHPSIELYCYDENGSFEKNYLSMTEACNDVHVSMSKISLALNQKRNKTSANRYWFTSPRKKEDIVFRKALRRNIPILQYSLDGNFLNRFNGQGEAERFTRVKSKLINKCLRINGYNQAGGYMWFYGNDSQKKINAYVKNCTKKPISQYDLNQNFITTYNSITEAARELNLTVAIIVTNLKHITKTCGGFVFTYINEKPEKYIDKRNSYIKKVLKFNINGMLLEEYSSIKEAAEINNVQRTSISANLGGKNKTAGGYVWKYKNN